MVPAFGFSVGDFIAAIELTIKISKALRETGGASTECRLVIQDLRNLQQVLETLQCLKPAGGDLSHINAIRGMAIACLLPLREFAEKIDRSYGPISGAPSSHRFLRRSGKSIQWSVFATEELAKFRVVIAAKVASIGLLLGVFNCQSLSTIETGSQITNTLLAQAAERRDLWHKELSQQATTHHGALSADITEARTQIKNEISSAEGEAGKRHDHLINRAEQHTNDLRALGHRMDRVYGDTCSNIKDVVDVCFRARHGNEQRFRSAERRFQKLGVEIQSLRYQQQQTSSRVTSSLQAVFVQIQIVRAIGASLLGSLIPFSEKILRYLRDNMQTNLETYALLLKIHADMPKKLENGDLILFQDVLGRTKSLPYEYFRHWDIFESMLRCEFKGLPGEDKVSQGQYLIMDGTLPGVEIDRHAWQEKVFPGTSVKMSVIIQSLHFLRGGLSETTVPWKDTADEELTLRSLEELYFEREEVRTPSPASKTSFSDTLSTNMKAQREERLKQEHEQAERELQEMMVFRMVHILQRSTIKPKAGLVSPNEDEDEDPELDAAFAHVVTAIEEIMNNNVQLPFEDTYRNAYKLVLSCRARPLHQKLIEMIVLFVNYLRKGAEDTTLLQSKENRPIHADDIAESAKLWRRFTLVLNRLSDVLMFMDRTIYKKNGIPSIWEQGLRIFREEWCWAGRDCLSKCLFGSLRVGGRIDCLADGPSDMDTVLQMVHELDAVDMSQPACYEIDVEFE